MFLEAVEINPVVVHGGGKRISRALEAAGGDALCQRLALPDIDSVTVVDQVLSQEINAEIGHDQLARRCAKGFAGTDIFTCKRHAPEGRITALSVR